MKICVSMITLNEEQYIQAAIESVIGLADKLVVVDGNSEDQTVRLVKETCEVNKLDYQLEIVPWQNHFGKQRQHSLDWVPENFDWWLRIDADERYSPLLVGQGRKILESIKPDVVAVGIKQVNFLSDNTYSAARGGWETHPRIFRNLRMPDGSPAWRWTGQVHEYCQLLTEKGLHPPEPEQVAYWNVSSLHYGWLSQERRQEREDLYIEMPGSSFQKGSLTQRDHIERIVPGVIL